MVKLFISLLMCISWVEAGLKTHFADHFLIGTAVNEYHFSERDFRTSDLIKIHCNSVTPENALKWESVHPELNHYTFRDADQFIDFGERNEMTIIGHVLIWHQQTPAWVFEDEQGNPINRDLLLERMQEHIQTVVSRYKGKIAGWDVVNEAFNDDGTMRPSPWFKILGEDYIIKAFEFARAADPDAELYYNDYGLENESKRRAALALVARLQQAGVPITAVGLQQHHHLSWPPIQMIDDTIVAFANLGIQVNISELDVDVLPQAWHLQGKNLSCEEYAVLDPYSKGLPDDINNALAERYAELFTLYLKHSKMIKRVTFWGFVDHDSWLNYTPIKGRTNYPLLFDRNWQPKPAFKAILMLSK